MAIKRLDVDRKNLLDIDSDDKDFVEEYIRVIDSEEVTHSNNENNMYDNDLSMELVIWKQQDNKMRLAHMKRRYLDVEGRLTGMVNENPKFDYRKYEVDFIDGEEEALSAIIISKNLLAKVKYKGHRQLMIYKIENLKVMKDCVVFIHALRFKFCMFGSPNHMGKPTYIFSEIAVWWRIP